MSKDRRVFVWALSLSQWCVRSIELGSFELIAHRHPRVSHEGRREPLAVGAIAGAAWTQSSPTRKGTERGAEPPSGSGDACEVASTAVPAESTT